VSPVNVSAWSEFPLRERLRELTAKRVYGDLDGKALALAEGRMGAAMVHDKYCVITVSTGIGRGIVLDGELLDGASTNGEHVGHLIVDPNGRRCSCGARLPSSRQAKITPTRLGDRASLIRAGAVGIRGWSRDRSRAARKRKAAS
jgi:predicted NBD/HSP70 family sugar kinase